MDRPGAVRRIKKLECQTCMALPSRWQQSKCNKAVQEKLGTLVYRALARSTKVTVKAPLDTDTVEGSSGLPVTGSQDV
eukprot:2465163-Amphidinium_carterae.1